MSLRTRLTLASAVAVSVAVALTSVIAYTTVRNRLLKEADRALRGQSEQIARGRRVTELLENRSRVREPFAREDQYFQVVSADGTITIPPDQVVELPVDTNDRRVAQAPPQDPSGELDLFRTVTVDGQRLRMITIAAGAQVNGQTVAIQIARPLTEIDNTLASLRVALIVVSFGGVALAAVFGLVIATATLRPVRRLTAAAEHVASTQDLSAEIAETRNDELGRLASSFNTMLRALAASREQQTQLVADASHELRTPLTSVRTNIEVLARQTEMPGPERAQLLADVTTQMEELSLLVGDLVELARGDTATTTEEAMIVRLDELVGRAVERAQLHAREVDVRLVSSAPYELEARPARLERALANVLDNAGKWSPAGGTVEVHQSGGTITVRDHGPGIDAVDLPHIFDRFYRAPVARGMPGSGLGLAIVRGIVEEHGGTVTAGTAEGGGTIMTIVLPGGRSPNG